MQYVCRLASARVLEGLPHPQSNLVPREAAERIAYREAKSGIVPAKAFADEMSTGVSYFEQFIWDLETRGVSDIDIPVMILGIDA